MAVMEFEYEGRSFVLDLEDMDTDQARAMERLGVANLSALYEGITTGDINSLTVLYWLSLVQNGEPGARIERVKFKPIKFLAAIASSKKDDAAEAEPGKDEGEPSSDVSSEPESPS